MLPGRREREKKGIGEVDGDGMVVKEKVGDRLARLIGKAPTSLVFVGMGQYSNLILMLFYSIPDSDSDSDSRDSDVGAPTLPDQGRDLDSTSDPIAFAFLLLSTMHSPTRLQMLTPL